MTYRPGQILLEAKHPREELDYQIPFSTWLAAAETIQISDVSVAVQSGLTLTPSGRPSPALTAGYDLVLWLGGGTAGSTYELEILATTSAGRKFIASCVIEIVDPTPAVP